MEALIIRVLQGNATPEEESRLEQWRRTSPENEREYRKLAEIWMLTGAGAPVRVVPPLPDLDRIIADAERAGDQDRAAAEPTTYVSAPPRRRARQSPMVIAAVIAVIAFAAALISGLEGWQLGGRDLGSVATGAGESVTVTLEDGTAIRVGPQSTLRLESRGSRRIAHLDGRAFFGVQRDPQRTFVVRTEGGDATVLGTRFEVRSEADHFRVFVVEGSVRLSAAGTSLDLTEGVLGESVGGAAPVTRTVFDAEEELAWMGRALVFQSTPLVRALAEIEERYAAQLILRDTTLAEMTLTASFTDRSLQEVVDVVCATLGTVCKIEGSVVQVGPELGRAPGRP